MRLWILFSIVAMKLDPRYRICVKSGGPGQKGLSCQPCTRHFSMSYQPALTQRVRSSPSRQTTAYGHERWQDG